MMNDTLAIALSNIQNAEKAAKDYCIIKPISKVIKKVLDVMKKYNYIKGYEVLTEARGGVIKVHLAGSINKCNAIKPRFPVKVGNYEKFEKRYLPAKNVGLLIVSTSRGIMTSEEAKEKNLGGVLLSYVY